MDTANKNNMKIENARGIQRQMMARDLVSSLALWLSWKNKSSLGVLYFTKEKGGLVAEYMIYFYKHDIQICESYRHDMQICESYRYEEQNIVASMISFHQHHKTHNRYKREGLIQVRIST